MGMFQNCVAMGFFQRSTHMEASVNIGLLGWFTSVSLVYFDTSGVFL